MSDDRFAILSLRSHPKYPTLPPETALNFNKVSLLVIRKNSHF